jgi:phosphatidate phosphatase PAH1
VRAIPRLPGHRSIGSTELKAYIYFLPWRTKIVISDIDGA